VFVWLMTFSTLLPLRDLTDYNIMYDVVLSCEDLGDIGSSAGRKAANTQPDDSKDTSGGVSRHRLLCDPATLFIIHHILFFRI
jgi:hypothetical protein